MKRFTVLLTVYLVATFILACSKKQESISLEENLALASNASVNRELRELKKKVKEVKKKEEKVQIFEKIAYIESEKGDVSSAMKSAEEAIKIDPGQADAHYVLGKSLLAAGKLDRAGKELSKALEINPEHAGAHFEMGNLLYKRYRFSEAEQSYKTSLEYNKDNYQAWNNIGVIHYLLKNYGQAEKAFLKVVQLKSDFAGAYKNLGILYDMKLGNKAKAVKYYGRYITHAPNAPERKAVEMWIAQLGGKK